MEKMIRSNASVNDQVGNLSNDERDFSVKVMGTRRNVRAKNPEDAVEKLRSTLENEGVKDGDGEKKEEK